MNQQFAAGCEAAKVRLGPMDKRRKSDRNYYNGWNSFTAATIPPSTLNNQAPTADQGAPAASGDTDTEAVKRLNEQELRRLKGQ
jgi:hypothetical protein